MKGTIQFITTVEIDGDNREEIENAYMDFIDRLKYSIAAEKQVRLTKDPLVVDSTGYNEVRMLPGEEPIAYSAQKLNVSRWDFIWSFVTKNVTTRAGYKRNAISNYLNDYGNRLHITWKGTREEANAFVEELKRDYPHLIKEHVFETDNDAYSFLEIDFF